MFLVKKSLVTSMTQTQVEARIAADLPVIREEVEKVVRSAPGFHSLLLAEWLFRNWSEHPDVRAGRARVRIVEIPEPRKAVNR